MSAPTHRRVIRWKSLAAAVVQIAASGAVTVLGGPKWGAAVAILAILVQSQMRRVIDKVPHEPASVTPDIPGEAPRA